MNTIISQTITATLRTFSLYSWGVAGVLFAAYIYFVGAITFSIIMQKQLTQQNKVLVSAMGKQELAYLAKDKMLSKEYAIAQGLVPASSVAFVSAQRTFAFNVSE